MEFTEKEIILSFLGFMLPFLAGYINNLLNRDKFKNENKETRRAIKNTIETQKILPVISEVLILISSKITFEPESNIEPELEGIIYNKENWFQLDSKIRLLEKEISLLYKLDTLYSDSITYASWYGNTFLGIFVLIVIGLIVYFLDNIALSTMWALLLVQSIILIIIIKWKLIKATKAFDDLETEYLR